MNEPTDNELEALIAANLLVVDGGQCAFESWADIRPELVKFARDVLAKWGTPAFVGVEPYAQHAIWHVRDGDMGWDQYHDSSDPMPLGWDGDAPDEVIDLYTAAQAQAGAVPLTCEWTHNEDGGFWDTECGQSWQLDDGGPKENNMHFCHHCGKPMHIKGGQHDL